MHNDIHNQAEKSGVHVSVGIIILVAGIVAAVWYSGALPASAQEYIAKARSHITAATTYDIGQAIALYEQALTKEPQNKEALFSLARLYYITGNYDKSLTTIEEYKTAYPQEKRIHYIAGLANAYAGNLSQAETEFQAFLNSDLAQWQGYLDLGWVYFKQGEFEKAKVTLEKGIEQYGHNAWLNTSLGATLAALGELEEAERVLRVAQVQANNITKDEWQHNYSFNNPESYTSGIDAMKTTIDLNLSIARGEVADAVLASQALRSEFISSSPRGFSHGLAVSACGASNSCETISCTSSSNACGDVSAGTRRSCTVSGSTSCNASTPPLPNGYGDTCQVTNACGNTSSGTIGCDGQCNATPPGQCDPFAPAVSSGSCTVGELYVINMSATDPEGDDIRYGVDWNNDGSVDQFTPSEGYASSGTTQSAGNVFATGGVKTVRVRSEDEGGAVSPFVSHEFVCSSGDASVILGGGGSIDPNIAGGLTAEPRLVHRDETTTLIWDTNGTDSCTVTGTNGDTFEGTSGTRTSGPIEQQTIFELNCDDGAVTDDVTVNVVPVFQEI